MTDPVTLYKDGKLKTIPAIDAQGWIANGWSESRSASNPKTKKSSNTTKGIPVGSKLRTPDKEEESE